MDYEIIEQSDEPIVGETAVPNDTGFKLDGRFRPGHSGNPMGRPKGSLNRATLAAAALLDGEAEELTRTVIELARNRDLTALRLCLERIVPPRRERLIQFDLPLLTKASDAPQAVAAVLAAVANGEITTSEAAELAKLVETFLKAIKAGDFEERLQLLEAKETA
jgi:hypothetical protein